MDILKEKEGIFGQIAALKVYKTAFTKNTSNSIPSINTQGDSLTFLIDILKSLVGFDALQESLVETLTQHLPEIEDTVKLTLKEVLKQMISCSINPSIPESFKTDGIVLEVDKIDFLEILKIEPTSQAGKLVYDDVENLFESTDFNTFLYNTIQDNGGVSHWGHVTTDNDILDVNFNAVSLTDFGANNTITVKSSAGYPPNKKLTDLNNDYIDSITLFSSPKMINNMIDSIFGSISVSINKNKRAIKKELEIKTIIDRIMATDTENVVIDDSFFEFSNDDELDINYKTDLKQKGVKMLTMTKNIESSIDVNDLTTLNDELDGLIGQPQSSSLVEQITEVTKKGLNSLAESSAENVIPKDKQNVKIDFMEEMLKNLTTSVINVVLSPKLILIFAMNHQIIYGETFDNPQDFLKKNKWMISLIVESVRDVVVSILLVKVLKEIKSLISDNLIKTQIEQLKAQKAQLASLVGIPNNILREISGLTKI